MSTKEDTMQNEIDARVNEIIAAIADCPALGFEEIARINAQFAESFPGYKIVELEDDDEDEEF
jgi:TusA-related sulfurtransferase